MAHYISHTGNIQESVQILIALSNPQGHSKQHLSHHYTLPPLHTADFPSLPIFHAQKSYNKESTIVCSLKTGYHSSPKFTLMYNSENNIEK